MPRTYIRKKPPPPYSLDDLESAVPDVANRNKTYREAEEAYRVPVSVIFHRLKGRKCSVSKMGAGRPTELSQEVEDLLVKCLIARSQMGFPCDKQELKHLVQEFIQANEYQTRFREGVPGDDWYQGFMRRNSKISLKKPEHLQKARKTARDPFVVYEFYDMIRDLYSDHSVDESCRSLIFNADESGFANDPCRLRAIGEKGVALNRVSDGSGRESTTILACGSASGAYLPPLIVFKGVSVQPRWISPDAYPGTMYAATSNGWMEEPTFFDWFSKLFIPHVNDVRQQKEVEGRTAFLFYDGHASHISIRIIELAIKNKVHLVKFPSHLTDKLQPFDKCVFGPLKMAWEKILVNHGKSNMGKGPSKLSKCEFSALLNKAWSSIKPTNVINGFLSTGLFPLDPSKFPEELFDPHDLARYKNKKMIHQKIVEKELGDDHNRLILQEYDEFHCRGEIVPTEERELEIEIALDLSIKNKNAEVNDNDTSKVTDLVAIFSRSISRNTASTSKSPMKKLGTRLKHHTYGEVLTSDEVIGRLREAEEKKENKIKSTVKKAKEPTQSKKPRTTSKETKRKLKELEESDDEELLEELPDIDDEELEDFIQNMEEELLEEVVYQDPTGEITTNTFLLVDIEGGKRHTTHFLYVCRVDAVSKDELEVTGLKSVNSSKNKFALVDNDKFCVSYQQIKAILPSPIIIKEGRKDIYQFNGTVCVKEV